MKKEGLYYRFTCVCVPPSDGLHRISVSDGSAVRDLGICVPDGDHFYLSARLPVKYLKGTQLSFALTASEDRQKVLRIPVESGAEFKNLVQLDRARLEIANGKKLIVINPVQVPQDSDRIPEHPRRSELR